MKNSFGQSVCLTIFGESHGAAVGCVIDGLAPGIKVDEDFIARQLTRRRPSSSLDTPRQEKDEFEIISGVFGGRTTGTPLTIVIPNENTRSRDYNYGPARRRMPIFRPTASITALRTIAAADIFPAG